jgi:sRNA-binding carbon storage regulator CsrA
MLILSRAPGQGLEIGSASLVISRIYPSVRLFTMIRGVKKEYEYSVDELYRQPKVLVELAIVNLLRLKAAELVVGIDAPRDVLIVRSEARRPPEPSAAET